MNGSKTASVPTLFCSPTSVAVSQNVLSELLPSYPCHVHVLLDTMRPRVGLDSDTATLRSSSLIFTLPLSAIQDWWLQATVHHKRHCGCCSSSVPRSTASPEQRQ